MSKRLGGIHQLLYKRICFLSEWNEALCIALHREQKHRCHRLQLTDLIDENNIHESLQEMMKEVQCEHAVLSERLVHEQGKEAAAQVIAGFGQRHTVDGDLTQLLKQIEALFLHGMPCERNLIMEVQDDTHARIVWKNDSQLQHYQNPSLWLWEREQLLQKMLPADYVYEEYAKEAVLYKDAVSPTWVEQLEYEHEMISHLLAAMQEYSLSILRTKQVDREWLKNCLDYLQEYADVFHHQKEEELVFSRLKQASPQGKLLVEQGMLVEHDLARYYIRSMKKLLKKDVTEKVCVRLIGFIQAYIDLLERHIEKENSVAYPYAVRKLAMDEIQKAFDAHGEYERMEELREFLKLF